MVRSQGYPPCPGRFPECVRCSVVLPFQAFPAGISAVDTSLSLAVMALFRRGLHGYASFLITVDASEPLAVGTGNLGINDFSFCHGTYWNYGSLLLLKGAGLTSRGFLPSEEENNVPDRPSLGST